jgi:hypothetical protein
MENDQIYPFVVPEDIFETPPSTRLQRGRIVSDGRSFKYHNVRPSVIELEFTDDTRHLTILNSAQVSLIGSRGVGLSLTCSTMREMRLSLDSHQTRSELSP